MGDRYFSIQDGLSKNLPSDTEAGRLLITTDTGDMYYEPEAGKRIEIGKQSMKQYVDQQTAASQFIIGNATSLRNVSKSQEALNYILVSRNQWKSSDNSYEYTIVGDGAEVVLEDSNDLKVAYFDQNMCFAYSYSTSEDVAFVDAGVIVYLDIRYNDGCFETYDLITTKSTSGDKAFIIPAITHSGIRSYTLRKSALTFTGTLHMSSVRMTIGGTSQNLSDYIYPSAIESGNYSANIYGKNLIPIEMFSGFNIEETGVLLESISSTGIIASGEFVAPTTCTVIASLPEGYKSVHPETEVLINDLVLYVKKNDEEAISVYGEHTAVFYLNAGDILTLELYVGERMFGETLTITPMLELGLYVTDWEQSVAVQNIQAGVSIEGYDNITLFPSDPNLMVAISYATTWKEYLDSVLGDISKILQTVVEVGDITAMLSTLVDGEY